jgi:CheY-like chemotaxis protein
MKKVVVAESSPTIKSVADSLLRQSGYDVVCTSDGLQAWEVISAEKPDLVLVGLSLSGLSGLDLCRQVSSDRLTGGIPVVLMVGANDSAREDELTACGARGRLKKPFSPKDILEIVGKLIGQKQATQPVVSNSATPQTKFTAQVSSTHHMQKKPETYNLEWLDLSDTTSTKQVSKVASFEVGNDDQTLIIEEDQYGLATLETEIEEAPLAPTPVVEEKDDDYDWFVGEMKREMGGKPSESRKAENRAAETPKISSDIGFDDIRPSDSPKPPSAHEKTAAISGGAKMGSYFDENTVSKPPSSPTPVFALSDEQIGRIADRIAVKLATHIVSTLDRKIIIEAIKGVLKQ